MFHPAGENMIRSVMTTKGGVAKTTTATAIAAALGEAGKKTLLIDADGQGTSSMYMMREVDFNGDEAASKKTLGYVLQGMTDIKECIWHTRRSNVDLIPSNMHLFDVIEAMPADSINGLPQLKLRKLLRGLDYDEIIIDNNPAVTMMTTNSIFAANQIIIPTTPDFSAVEGVRNFLNYAAGVIEELDSDVDLDYMILMVKVNRNNNEKAFIQQMEKMYGDHIYRQRIRYQPNPLEEVLKKSQLITDDHRSNIAMDFRNFLDEFIAASNTKEMM
jgi:chromosome partitioning protein